MEGVKTVRQWLDQLGLSVQEFADRAALDKRLAQRVVNGQWTADQKQRERIAVALGVGVDSIHWGHATPVEHMYGHGPQFGRSP